MMYYHTYLSILIPMLFTFLSTIAAIKFLMPHMLDSGVTATDYNKKTRPVLPSGMGTALSFGFSIGLLVYIFGASFSLFGYAVTQNIYLLAATVSLLLIALVGFIDDINVRKTKVVTTGMMDTRVGLKQWQKPILTLIGAIPLIAINAGVSTLHLPFIGMVNFGLWYPLFIIPLAVVFAANSFNLLGGFNGISTASGLVISLALLIYAIVYGSYTGAILAGVLSATLIAFALYDNYPAKMIPGDSFTYAVGAGIAITAILGNMESFAAIIFLPWFIEFILHLRGKFKITDLGKRRADGTFEPPYGKKIYSWTHILMNMKRCKEWEVTLYMTFVTFGFVILGFALKIFGLL